MSVGRLLPWALVLGMACNGGKDDDTTTDDADDDDVCVSSILSTFPEDLETGVFYRTSIEVNFNQAEDSSSATVTLADSAGTDVPGTTTFSTDGKTAFFDPTADLMSSETYTLTVAYSCDRTATITFTTSDVGTPVADPSSLVGKVFNVDFINSGRIVEPAGIDGLVRPLLSDVDIALMVTPTEYTAPEMTMAGAIFDDNGDGTYTQDECIPTIALDPADFSENPFFQLSGEDTVFSILGFTIEVASLDLSGAFSEDGSSIQGVALGLNIDTEQLAGIPELEDLVGDQDLCTLVSSFGVQCEDCGDGSITCLTLGVADILAEEEAGVTFMMISDDDVTNNPECAEDTDTDAM